jgi:hypothetical protein
MPGPAQPRSSIMPCSLSATQIADVDTRAMLACSLPHYPVQPTPAASNYRLVLGWSAKTHEQHMQRRKREADDPVDNDRNDLPRAKKEANELATLPPMQRSTTATSFVGSLASRDNTLLVCSLGASECLGEGVHKWPLTSARSRAAERLAVAKDQAPTF